MILAKRDVSWYANFTKKQGGHMLILKIGMTWSRQDEGQNSQFNINSYFLQVSHVWPLCRIWRSFWDILNMISSMRQRWTQKGIKMRSNHVFECTKTKPSSRRSKQTYGSPNSESGCRSYGARKFAYLGKTSLTGFGNRSDRFWLLCSARSPSDRIWWPVWPVFSRLVRIRVVIWF